MAVDTQSIVTAGAVGSPQQVRHIIRVLLRSRYLSTEDQLNLALTNKNIAGVIDIERFRLNVMDVLFEHDDSLVNQAIRSDQQHWLEYLLGIGDFTSKEAENSINGLLMHCADDSDGEHNRLHHTMGTHRLLELCLRFDAVRCLQSLIQYCNESCFNYDPDWLYRKAKLVAWKDYKVQGLLFLHSYLQQSDDNPLEELWGYLLTQARNSSHVRTLARVMDSGTDYFPCLIHHCGRLGECSPFVLLELIKRVPIERLTEQVNFRGMLVTPLSIVSSGLRLSNINLLLKQGGIKRPFEHYHRDPVGGFLTNPLFSLLMDISLPYSEDIWYSYSESRKDWIARARDMTRDLHTVVKLFEVYAREEFQFELKKHVDMNTMACRLFVNLLRNWFIKIGESSLDQATQDELLRYHSMSWNWKEGVSGPILCSVFTSNHLNLFDGDVVAVWDTLRTHEIEQEAEALLRASSGPDCEKGNVSWTSIDYLYALIAAPQLVEVAELRKIVKMASAPSGLPDYGNERFESVIQVLQELPFDCSRSSCTISDSDMSAVVDM
ncbi:hypothetical protein QBC41DRAFT_351616 [Cercophora samala]|uniref:Uncharacterized protein n=1 Tax=Cercophora samala TaxID=330535 RepID=A0AA39YJB4_9PEZI|nr:hypothetical protein QBC41DRAFT_351616 [Cercophora samala]